MRIKYLVCCGLAGLLPLCLLGEVLLKDSFSGISGSSLVGSSLDSGGVWSHIRTDGGGVMAGTYVFTDDGGVVLSNDLVGSVYTTFPAETCMQSLTNGLTVSMTFFGINSTPCRVTSKWINRINPLSTALNLVLLRKLF